MVCGWAVGAHARTTLRRPARALAWLGLLVGVACQRSAEPIDKLQSPLWGEQQKFVGANGNAHVGSSLAMSNDTALVGRVSHSSGSYYGGSCAVYVRSAGGWGLQAFLESGDNYRYGRSVALSADTAIVGGGYLRAEVFARTGTSWGHQQTIERPSFGFAGQVALSGDTTLIADTDYADQLGGAIVMVRVGTNWSEQQVLTAGDTVEGDSFAYSLALSGDTALVGAIGDSDKGSYSGSVYVFVRSGTIWSLQQKLTASDGAASDGFGTAVALLGDTALIGAPAPIKPGASGAAYVFVRAGTVWTEQQKLTASDAGADNVGGAVALSNDLALVGASLSEGAEPESGAAYVFARSGSVWSEQQKLFASDGREGDRFGEAVAVATDSAFVGAPLESRFQTERGAAYVFALSAAGASGAAGEGGAGASTGSAGRGGNTGNGGNAGNGGSADTGGESGTAGSGGAAGGGGSTSSGGAPSIGGRAGANTGESGGDAGQNGSVAAGGADEEISLGPGASDSTDDGGCACHISNPKRRPLDAFVLVLLVVAQAIRRNGSGGRRRFGWTQLTSNDPQLAPFVRPESQRHSSPEAFSSPGSTKSGSRRVAPRLEIDRSVSNPALKGRRSVTTGVGAVRTAALTAQDSVADESDGEDELPLHDVRSPFG